MDIKRRKKYLRVSFVSDKGLLSNLLRITLMELSLGSSSSKVAE